MSDTLEALLLQLASMKHAAQAMIATEYPPDALWDFDGDNRLWLGMEQTDDGGWAVGWLMCPDEATYFALEASGRTPIEAALNLRTKMIKGE